MATSDEALHVTNAFSLPFGYLAPLQTLWEHFLRRVFVKERPHTILQKASAGLWDLLRGAPGLIRILSPSRSSPPFLLQQAEDSVSLSFFNVHYSGLAPCRGLRVGSWLWVVLSVNTHTHTSRDWNVAGVFVSVFVPLLLPRTAGNIKEGSLFSLYSCCHRCVALFAVAMRFFCVF